MKHTPTNINISIFTFQKRSRLKDKKDLIEIAKSINITDNCESYNRFATNFLMDLKRSHIEKTESFFNILKDLKPSNKGGKMDFPVSVKMVLGKQGKLSSDFTPWYDSIIHKKELEMLDLEELIYVFGYAARLSKIEKSDHCENRSSHVSKKEEKAPAPKISPEETVHYCPTCKKNVDFKTPMLFQNQRMRCPNCKKPVSPLPKNKRPYKIMCRSVAQQILWKQ